MPPSGRHLVTCELEPALLRVEEMHREVDATDQRSATRVARHHQPAFALPLKFDSARDCEVDLAPDRSPLAEFDRTVLEFVLSVEGVGDIVAIATASDGFAHRSETATFCAAVVGGVSTLPPKGRSNAVSELTVPAARRGRRHIMRLGVT
eukprot:CAMPEP_0185310494 /NCGR_PEP_ID=MMETSP1363-20130426/25439_1 /TAXON_ID=38817 /ORGANISM="Gephyrocapsa oceanica, Strain RCC1303" /LENGTH=149 /DNA_ID=CAMNT_0027908069 /DNA_START=350 /DNA_END=800 /DNA_ORIENTATION=+